METAVHVTEGPYCQRAVQWIGWRGFFEKCEAYWITGSIYRPV